jgi:molecular chaperone GrpE
LAVKDSLELGVDAASGKTDAEKLREGIELTLKMLVQVMEKFNIEEIDPKGAPFDPTRHQAMTMQENQELPPNTVVAVMQKGYALNERLLRPAMVIVSKAPEEGARD